MGNIGMLALLLFIRSSSSSPVERERKLLADNLRQKCNVNCQEMRPGNVTLVPFFCFVLFPAVPYSCTALEPSPVSTGSMGPAGPPGQPCNASETSCEALETLLTDRNVQVIKEYIINNREFIVLKKLNNQTLVRVGEADLKEAFTSLF